MIEPDVSVDVPATVRYHRDVIEEIVQCVEEGTYCALLGPRLCGKTLLLRYIESDLARLLGWTCAYINLLDIRPTTQQAFFADLMRQLARQLTFTSGFDLPHYDESSASSAEFRAFLGECLDTLDRDLVLMIDPLEALPTDLVQALLTSLRAAYMDQQVSEHQAIVVVSGSLSLANLTVGESSPFRGIARRVFMSDLSEQASQTLILELLSEQGVSATDPAIQKLLQATCGDIYLIRKIGQSCADLVQTRSMRTVRSRDVDLITDRFLRHEVFQYAPLVEAVRLIEEDPDLLQCILLLMSQSRIHRSALPLPLSPDLDPLYLTGVVERDPTEYYQLQNSIYHRFLAQHFHPGRVGFVLSMAGRWDSAIDYLDASIQQGNQQSRLELLPAAINSMFAAQDLARAVHFLLRSLQAAFGVTKSQIWFNPPHENYLTLISPISSQAASDQSPLTPMLITADRLEARAFRQRVTLRGHEGDQSALRAIPLLVSSSKAIGVVTIYDTLVNEVFQDLRERDLELVGFLNQAARAIEAVSTRRQELILAGRVQASLLPGSTPQLAGWQIATAWHPARETSGDFYDFIHLPGGRLGIVIADVVDKGMGPALLMTLTRTLIRTYAEELADHPDRLLQITNQRILRDVNAGLFVTLFYGVLDPVSGQLTYCNAGQPPPYVLTGGDPILLMRTGMALGISEEETWEKASVHIPPQALLLLYTDGVLDADNRRGEFFGSERMLELVRSRSSLGAEEIKNIVLTEIFSFSEARPQLDDITLMVLARG
jgi:serine phosphatase RsbU (regulator of sigma subunit)